MKRRHCVGVTRAAAASITACLALLCVPTVSSAAASSESGAEGADGASAQLARGAGYGQPQGEPRVRALQRRLRRLGYVVGRAGSYDARTARAVIAFRKVTGIRRSGDASVSVMRRIARGKGTFTIRRPGDGRHIEADLTRQVIALVDGGRVRRIYPISSGKPGTSTVLGSFHVYLKTRGTNARGMVDSAYFVGGYATHGYNPVPNYPASHGCLRNPIPDSIFIYNWIDLGDTIYVYH